MRRSTPEERTELKSIMEMIVLGGNDDSQETHCDDGGQEEEERQTAKSTKDEKKNPDIHTPQKKGSSAVDPAVTFALVERHETPPTSKVGASSGSSPTSLNKISPSKVFRGILKKKKKTKQQKKAEEEEGDGSSSEPVESSPPQINKKKALRRRLSFEDASESDEEEDKKAKLTILPAGKKIMNDKENARAGLSKLSMMEEAKPSWTAFWMQLSSKQTKGMRALKHKVQIQTRARKEAQRRERRRRRVQPTRSQKRPRR